MVTPKLKLYKIPDAVQFIEKTMENCRGEDDSGRKYFSRDKDPKKHITGRCIINIIMCDRHDANSTTSSGNAWPATNSSKAQKMLNHFMHMDDIDLFTKNENNWKHLYRL